jgi:hypothetical protein
MISLAVLSITLLWILSIFSFAKWRHAAIAAPDRRANISTDLVFQVYLKLSGLAVLFWIGLMLTIA